jgi:hypothetical protein
MERMFKRRFSLASILGACLLFGAHARAAELPSACAQLSKTMDTAPPGPVFLPSYPTAKSGALLDAAFLYDNAVAVIALTGCGDAPKAMRIGDAFLAALDNDRYWHDGRLRNGYLAGSARDNPLKLAGWWDDKQNMWVEDRYQVGSDTGNMAWAMLALLALDKTAPDRRYRDGAARIGTWVLQWRDTRGAGGFTGGAFAHEPSPVIERWKSTEHNADLAAAFTALAKATGDVKWRRAARDAASFVRAMWSVQCQCFAVGTIDDGATRNPYLALDAQVWPQLAIPGFATRYRAAVATANARLRDSDGFAYSEAKEGLWTEGTAQMALLLDLTGRDAEAEPFRHAVEAMRAPDGFYYAASTRELRTGFMLETDPTQPRQYFHIPHLAALSWAALAEKKFNPFTGARALPAK